MYNLFLNLKVDGSTCYMESVLRKLKVDIEDCKAGTLVELFIAAGDKRDDTGDENINISMQSLDGNKSIKYLSIRHSELGVYFEQEIGLDKVYSEYRAKVSSDLIKSGVKRHKETIKLAIIALISLLIMVCTAAWFGGAVGIAIIIVSLFSLLTFIIALNSRSKRRIKLDSHSMQECKNVRKRELLHMLTNLGYIDGNSAVHVHK